MKDTRKRQGLVGGMIKNIKDGDRVIWIIVVLLTMFSLVAIFSSTSLLAIKEKVSRFDIFMGQVKVVGLGALILLLSTAISSIKFFRGISRWGFALSLLLLTALDCHINAGSFIKTITINGATRAIRIGGFNLQVFEVVKIAMVMYLAWAVQTYESGKFRLANRLGTRYPRALGWMKDARAQRWIYIFLPILITTLMIFPGSTGSALLTAIVMMATIMIGGIKFKDLAGPVAIGIAGILLVVLLHIVSSGKVMPRMQTAFNRLKIELPYPDEAAKAAQKERLAVKKSDPHTLEPGTQAFRDYLDEIRQPAAAEIAIVQGARNIVGKGPGKSTQKYVVPVMFEDYMFSFIVEEYGLIVGFLIIIMYMSLFARGTIIVHTCANRYAKACVGGLVFLITFQALFHILVNCNVGLLTGQTLPLISHGRCSFLCFCFAFGVILSISKMANHKIAELEKQEKAVLERDEIGLDMDIVESIDDELEALENAVEGENEPDINAL